MTQLRTTLILSYSTIAVVCLGMAGGIWYRSTDPTWADTLRDVRWEYNTLGGAVIGFALLVAVGLFLRREWGRIFSISLSLIVLFMSVGLPLYASLSMHLRLGAVLSVDSVVMGSLALLNAIALFNRKFRNAYASSEPRRRVPK